MLSDQHLNDVTFAGTAAMVELYAAMKTELARLGAPVKMYIGEEDCSKDKRTPNDAFCHSQTRALAHSLLSNGLARLGSDFVVGQAPCDQFGAHGRQVVWPQAQLEFTASTVLWQPPALAQQMLAAPFIRVGTGPHPAAPKLEVLAVAPALFTVSGDNESIVDVLALRRPPPGWPVPRSGSSPALVIRMVNTHTGPAAVELQFPSEVGFLAPLTSCTTLACDPLAVNTLDSPAACSPQALPTGATRWHGSVLNAVLPASSFTMCDLS